MSRARRTGVRTVLGGIDPGLARLRLAGIAVAAMLLAVAVTEGLRATVARGEPVTLLLFAGVLAMFANILVAEPTLRRRRATTLLMIGPALAGTVVGALIAPHRLAAIVVFVLLMALVVWLRRYGARADALGTAAFIPYYSTQFLHAAPEQVLWLVVAALVGISSTFLLRCVLLPERPERTLRRLVGAFTARAHALVAAVDGILAELGSDGPGAEVAGSALERMRRARDRLGQVALQVEGTVENSPADRTWPGLADETLSLRIFDAELALERLAVVVRDLAVGEGAVGGAAAPRVSVTPEAVTALRAGLGHLRAASTAGAGTADVRTMAGDARAAVAGLVALAADDRGERRAGLAVHRLADAVEAVALDVPPDPGTRSRATVVISDEPLDGPTAESAAEPSLAPPSPRSRLDIATRQAVQIAVAASLTIVVAELLVPTRWYWAVLTVFVVFTSTQSRGDLLTRGWLRVLGTAGGVLAGMGVAVLVDGDVRVSLVLIFVGVFLALYFAGVSPALLAFWITAVLALLYGALGQFTPELIWTRLAETAIGAAASVLAAFLILPRGSRTSLGEAVGEFLAGVDAELAAVADRVTGRTSGRLPFPAARRTHAALATVRARVDIVTIRSRGRTGHRRVLRMLTVCEHYLRALVRLSGDLDDPGWAATLDPAVSRVRANLRALAEALARGRVPATDAAAVSAVRSLRGADPALDDAEDHVLGGSGQGDLDREAALAVVRLVRRVDQAVVGLGTDLGLQAADPASDHTPDDPAAVRS